MNMFTPRGYTAVPQEAASQDEDESIDKNPLSQSFNQRKNLSALKNTEAMHSTSRNSRESEVEEGETKERRVKRNVRFESRSLEERPEPLSNARRLCFVVSLMICTLTIFVFAFTVPCKGPSCNVANMITTVTSNLEEFHKNWSMSFPAFSTGIVFHLSSSKTREVVVSYNGKQEISKHSTKVTKHEIHKTTGNQKKWSTKESGLISLKEDNGEFLWLFNASDVVKLIECRTDDNHFETCLIQSSHGRLQLINPKRNQIIWSTRILIGSILPSIIIGINDCDGDDGRDILLSYDRFNTTCMLPTNKTFCTHPGVVQLISGRTGYPLGSRLNIPQSHLIKRVSIHSTRHAENLIFVLTVGNKGHLKVISIQKLYRKILEGMDSEPTLFNNSTLSVSDIVSTDHEPVVKDLNKDFVEDIILVTLAGNKHSLTAVDGGKLKKMWRIAFGSRKMLSQPVIGHFNDDEIPDILVILEDPVLSFFNQSLVQILDGQNGNILWTRKLRLAKNTTPLTANVRYKSDIFLLWIEKESKRKYKKIFLSKAPKESSNDIGKQVNAGKSKSQAGIRGKQETQPAMSVANTHHVLQTNESENSIAQDGHHRSPRSTKFRKEERSVNDMTDELDSLVDEIFVKDNKNIPRTKSINKPLRNVKKNGNTHKILEDILKKEGQSLEVVKKEHGSLAGGAKATISTRLVKQGPKLYTIHGMHKPSMQTRRRFRQMTSSSSHGKLGDGSKSKPTTANIVHTLTEGQKFKKVIINKVDSKMDDRGETTSSTLPTTQPESRVSVKTARINPTTNDGRIEQVIVQNSIRQVGDHHGGKNEHGIQSQTAILPTHREIQKTRARESGGKLDHVGIQKRLGENRNSNHPTNDVTLPTSNPKYQHNKATTGKAVIRNIHQISEDVLLAIHPVTRPDQIHHSGKTNTKTAAIKFKNTVRATYSPYIQGHRHTEVTVKTMADFKSKSTPNKTRSGKDILILPTKIPTTEQPTSNTLTILLEKKHQRQIERKTTQSSPKHPKQQNGKNEKLKVDIPRGKKISSHDMNKHSGTTNKLENRPEHLNKSNHDQNIVNKLIKSNVSASSSPHPKANKKVRLSNGGNMNELLGNKKAIPHLHSIEVNRTGHLDENKMIRVIERKLKPNTSGMPRKQQLSNTSKDHRPKASGHQTTLQHPTTINHHHTSDEKKKHDIPCPDGFNLALIAIFPNSHKNSFSIVSQENSIKKPKGSSAPCGTLWPSLNTSPLVRDADSDGFLDIVYAVNYGRVVQNARTMKVRKFSLKVDSEE
ncbi:uncharacterized protein LOC114521701 [Dendronephthya gigantea]|uniref:uncharacterized protein LOC114521701 n=1 Tax=Dendronephthya gigantea TaxID=151771 RepID=UPI00106D8D66|nr:uncharacterized protein LOC114521701 [Dendronephthya gigantea]